MFGALQEQAIAATASPARCPQHWLAYLLKRSSVSAFSSASILPCSMPHLLLSPKMPAGASTHPAAAPFVFSLHSRMDAHNTYQGSFCRASCPSLNNIGDDWRNAVASHVRCCLAACPQMLQRHQSTVGADAAGTVVPCKSILPELLSLANSSCTVLTSSYASLSLTKGHTM